MKIMLSICLFLGCMAIGDGHTATLKGFIVAIREDVFLANQPKVRTLLTKIWELSEQKPLVMNTGWKRCYHSGSGNYWYLYDISEMQINKEMHAAEIAELEAILASSGGVKYDTNLKFQQALAQKNMTFDSIWNGTDE